MTGVLSNRERANPRSCEERLRAPLDAAIARALRWVRAGGPVWRLGRHSVYRLPWYLVIGEAGAGKSAMLHAFGARPAAPGPIAIDAPVQWWFDEQAVLLEATVGDEAQDALWSVLSKRLKRVRRRCPVNGVIVAVPADRLLDGDQTACMRYAAMLHERIGALYRRWGVRIPVYVAVTRCDRVAGFDAFVEGLADDARDRSLGIVLPLTREPVRDGWLAFLPEGFESLTQEARAHVIARMPQRSAPRLSAMIYRFPGSFGELTNPLIAFLREAFGSSPHAEDVLLRGVHFSAVLTNSTNPASASMERPASSIPGRGRACFVAGFWRDAVFAEQALAHSRYAMPHRRVIQARVAAISFAALALLSGAMLVTAYRRGSAAIAATAPGAASLVRAASTGVDRHAPRAMLALLDAAHDLPCGKAWQNPNPSWLAGIGLVRETHLESACRAAYRTVLRETLQPYVLERMSDSLRAPGTPPSALYRTLRAYLMLGGRAHYDRATVLAWIADDAGSAGLPAPERAAWLAHAAAWADPGALEKDVVLDAALVAHARETLRAQPAADRVFGAIVPALQAALPEPLSVAEMAGSGAALVLYRKSGGPLSGGVPGPYTLAGYRRYLSLRDGALARARRDAWVLDPRGAAAAGPQALADEVDRLYFARYIEAWDGVIDDVGLRPLPKSEDGAAIVKLLARRDSPLRAFFERAAKETTLAAADEPAPEAAQGASGPLDAMGRKVRQWLGTSQAPAARPNREPAQASARASATAVDRHFDALHRLVSGSEGASTLDKVQQQLKEAAVYLDAAGVARTAGLPAPADDALKRLEQEAAGLPAPLAGMLKGLSEDGTAAAQAAERARLNERWRADVASFCHAAIDGRYPFVADADADVTPDDFAKLFAPGGLIDTFFAENLKPYVDTATSPWTWRAGVAPRGLSIASLREFERAARIRDAFFPAGSKTMDVRFSLTARVMDVGLTRFVFAFGGQTLDYEHGPLRATPFAWPDRTGGSVARIGYAPADADGHHGVETHGAWALFRLLDRGRFEALEADRFALTFTLDRRSVTLELAAASVVNPFALAALREFRCPSVL